MQYWLEKFAPDVDATLRRFPLAVLLAALGTILVISLSTALISDSLETWFKLAAGLFTGAIFAAAGVLFAESRPNARAAILILAYVLPLASVALLQISGTRFLISPLLPVIGLFWLSISPVTHWGKGDERADIQNLFWWVNHRAIATAVIAGVAFGLVSLGLIAVERSLATLFGLEIGEFIYQFLLPFTGLFLTPVYWLSTLPDLSDYSPKEMDEPDFLSRAIGFLGQFILAPFLFIYALILLAYAVQIVVTLSLPEGMLGWMVLGFIIVGAATWLVLHPKFMHERWLVKQFRRWWFWLTLVPLILYFAGVSVRIDAYGLTELRMGLLAGGLWAGLLTLVFLTRRFADIRLIPGLAGAIILVLSVGPWNFVNLPLLHQNMRLEAAIHNATPVTQSMGGSYEWSEEGGKAAAGAIDYLSDFEGGRALLARTLALQGISLDENQLNNSSAAMAALELNSSGFETGAERWLHMVRAPSQATDVSQTPFALGIVELGRGERQNLGGLTFRMSDEGLHVADGAADELILDLLSWKGEQQEEVIVQPLLMFEVAGIAFVLLVEEVGFLTRGGTEASWDLVNIRASLFSDKRPETVTD